MQTLEKRIEALEQASPTGQNTVIIIRYDVPGNLGRELRNLNGPYTDTPLQHWTRMDGESVDDFTARASREVKRNAYGVGLLFQND